MKGVKLITGNKRDRFPEINFKLVHTSRIFVLNSKKVYTTPYSHQSSLMMYVFENYGYNFYSIMAFRENATFVFWLCQNS